MGPLFPALLTVSILGGYLLIATFLMVLTKRYRVCIKNLLFVLGGLLITGPFLMWAFTFFIQERPIPPSLLSGFWYGVFPICGLFSFVFLKAFGDKKQSDD